MPKKTSSRPQPIIKSEQGEKTVLRFSNDTWWKLAGCTWTIIGGLLIAVWQVGKSFAAYESRLDNAESAISTGAVVVGKIQDDLKLVREQSSRNAATLDQIDSNVKMILNATIAKK